MSALEYEFFVRKAFGVSAKGDDPAGLAVADYFNSAFDTASLNKIKIGTAYAIAIYNNQYSELKALRDPSDYERMDQFMADILHAKNVNDVGEIIESYTAFKDELEQLTDR